MATPTPSTVPTPPNNRHVLPSTRRSITHKFCIAGHEGYLTIGLFDNNAPGEIFIKMSKEGSTLSGLIQGFCRAFSLALQYGLTIEDAVDRFRGMRFDPMGATNNPDIPEASSILDYVARFLELFHQRHVIGDEPLEIGPRGRQSPRSTSSADTPRLSGRGTSDAGDDRSGGEEDADCEAA
jgi:ribonucleoside-diphosphate reductase alpha chain